MLECVISGQSKSILDRNRHLRGLIRARCLRPVVELVQRRLGGGEACQPMV